MKETKSILLNNNNKCTVVLSNANLPMELKQSQLNMELNNHIQLGSLSLAARTARFDCTDSSTQCVIRTFNAYRRLQPGGRSLAASMTFTL